MPTNDSSPWSAFHPVEDCDQEDDDDDLPDLDDSGDSIGGQLARCPPRPYRLVSDFVQHDKYKHPVKLPVVADREKWGRARINFGQRYLAESRHGSLRLRGSRGFESSLDGDVKRDASMELADDSMLTMQMGVRRGPRPTDEQVSRGVFFYDSQSPHWTARHVTEDFYPSLIHPYVANSQAANPFDWAFERATLANGFTAVMGLTHDCPPAHIEYPYLKLAPRMFNATPESLVAPRTIILDSAGREFFHGVHAVLGDCCTPETMWFLLMHRENLSLGMIASTPVCDFVKKIPRCLENGLVIDRLDQLFQIQRTMGDSPQIALATSLELIAAIYGGENRPWWFVEDIDFSHIYDAGIDRQILLRLAQRSGFAFQYAVALYREAPDVFQLEGISHGECIDFLAFVASTYGIGNTPRAKNILVFAREYLERVSPSQRISALESFQQHLERERPASEIIGKMEGEDASFHLPGIMELMHSQLGLNFIARERMDSLVVQVPHLLALAMPLARPLLERAMTEPTVDTTHKHRLLAASSSSRLLLPVADEHQLTSRLDPLHGIFAFYQQLMDECGGMDETVAAMYFSFIAPKMPDPFAPPSGFLKSFQAYSRIKDPGYDQIAPLAFSWLPGVQEAREKNHEVVVGKYLLIANLVDAWIMGIITEERLLGILAWVTSGPQPEDFAHRAAEIRQRAYARRDEYFEAKRLFQEGGLIQADGAEGHPYWDFDARDDVAFSDEAIEDRIRHQIEGDAREFPSEFTKKRYIQLLFAHGVICVSNIFVTLGMLQPEDLREVLNQDISLMSTYASRDHVPRGNGNYLGTFIRQFDVLREKGMIDSSAFRDYFSRIPQPVDRAIALMRFLDEVARVPDTLQAIGEAESAIFAMDLSFIRSGSENAFDYDAESLLSRATEALEAKCLDIWSDSPFVTLASIRAYIAQHFDPRRLMVFAVSLRQLRSQISQNPPQFIDTSSVETSKWSRSVAQTTAMVGGLVTMVMLLDHDGGEDSLYSVAPLDPHGSDAMRMLESSFFSSPVSPVTAIRQSSTFSIRALSGRLSQAYPKARELIHHARRESIGLVPVGGKIQLLHAIDSKRFERFRDLLGLSQTSFRLIHAGTSLILPPTPSASELKAIIHTLRLSGVVDSEFPEIQISAPGRLFPRNVAIRSSAVMFASTKCIEYDREAFSTTHNESTGARKCAYDAGGESVVLPFMSKLDGRTDSLGHLSEDDIELVQLLHTVLIQGQVGQGPFANLSRVFSDRYLAILKKYGLGNILDGSWIYLSADSRSDNNASDTHYHLVKRVTDAYFSCSDRYRETGAEDGIIFDVRRLFDWLRAEVKQRQEAIYLSGKPCTEVRILLEL